MGKFKVGDRVKLVGSGKCGKVTSVRVADVNGAKYQVCTCRFDGEAREVEYSEYSLLPYPKSAEPFKVGDRVIETNSGKHGIVIDINCEEYGGKKYELYLCRFDGEPYTCQCNEYALCHEIKSPNWRIEITPDGDETTAELYGKNGKLRRSATVKRYREDKYDVCTAAHEAVKKLFDKPPESKSADKAEKISALF